MAVSAEDIAYVTDLFSDLGKIFTRKMMGGLCIYCDGTIFALIGPEDRLFVKARAELAQKLADEGSTQFVYTRKGGAPSGMPYWTFPEAALDDPEEACDWARKSLHQNE